MNLDFNFNFQSTGSPDADRDFALYLLESMRAENLQILVECLDESVLQKMHGLITSENERRNNKTDEVE